MRRKPRQVCPFLCPFPWLILILSTAKPDASESTETAPKRGRSSKTTTADAAADSTSDVTTITKKDKRGRTAGAQLKEELQEAIDESKTNDTEPEAPKKRGRPAKAALESSAAATKKSAPKAAAKTAATKTATKKAAPKAAAKTAATKTTTKKAATKATRKKVAIEDDEPEESVKIPARGRRATAKEEMPAELPTKGRGGAKKSKVDADDEPAQVEAPKKGRPKRTAAVEDEPVTKPTARGRGKRAALVETEAEPAPKTTSRGRGKRAAPSESEEVIEPPAKKARGRPAKKAATAPQDETLEPSTGTEEEIPKKKRGRPSKSGVATIEPETHDEGKTEAPVEVEDTPKKKRGRPSKAEAPAIGISKDVAGPEQEAQELEESAVDVPDATPKRRGRPPKGATPATAPAPKTSTPVLLKTPTTDIALIKKLGRPPKNTPISAAPGATSVSSTGRGRGRPRKSDATAEKAAESTPMQPPSSSKPRGRPPKSTPTTTPATSSAKPGPGRPRKSDAVVSSPIKPPSSSKPRGRPKRPAPSSDEEDDSDARPVKRQRLRKSEDFKTPPKKALVGPSNKPERRLTMAAHTPRAHRAPLKVPGTAPPKATSRPGGKLKASLKEMPATNPPVKLHLSSANGPAEDLVEPSNEEVEAAIGPVTPKGKKLTTKPPKTAPPKGILQNAKKAASKRKRVSSPGPAVKRVQIDEDSLLAHDKDAASTSEPSFWLCKAEPDSRIEKGIDVKFSIDDLKNATEPEPWSGVRNYGARNHMMNMKKGELAFFYHSSCKVPGIVGIMEIVQEATVDGKSETLASLH